MKTGRVLETMGPLAFVTLLTAAAATAQAAEPVSYPLICRAGANPHQLTVAGEAGRSSLTVSFRGAAVGADSRAPARGECAWRDRGWRDGEPQTLMWSGRLQQMSIEFAPDGKVGAAHARSSGRDGADLSHLLGALRNGEEYRVLAYRDTGAGGAQYLRVTQVHTGRSGARVEVRAPTTVETEPGITRPKVKVK